MKSLLILIILSVPLGLMAQGKSVTPYTCHEDSIFYIVDQMPAYPGGEIALRKYIATHLRCPEVPIEEVNIGKVYVEFCVTKTGNIERIKVIRSVHPLYDKEAVRLVKSLPKWKPGKHKGKLVCAYYVLPIYTHWKK